MTAPLKETFLGVADSLLRLYCDLGLVAIRAGVCTAVAIVVVLAFLKFGVGASAGGKCESTPQKKPGPVISYLTNGADHG